MIQFTCDRCGRLIDASREARYEIHIEVQASTTPNGSPLDGGSQVDEGSDEEGDFPAASELAASILASSLSDAELLDDELLEDELLDDEDVSLEFFFCEPAEGASPNDAADFLADLQPFSNSESQGAEAHDEDEFPPTDEWEEHIDDRDYLAELDSRLEEEWEFGPPEVESHQGPSGESNTSRQVMARSPEKNSSSPLDQKTPTNPTKSGNGQGSCGEASCGNPSKGQGSHLTKISLQNDSSPDSPQRFDLCECCFAQYQTEPLGGRDASRYVYFSRN